MNLSNSDQIVDSLEFFLLDTCKFCCYHYKFQGALTKLRWQRKKKLFRYDIIKDRSYIHCTVTKTYVHQKMGDLACNNSSSYCLGVKHLGILKLKRIQEQTQDRSFRGCRTMETFNKGKPPVPLAFCVNSRNMQKSMPKVVSSLLFYH